MSTFGDAGQRAAYARAKARARSQRQRRREVLPLALVSCMRWRCRCCCCRGCQQCRRWLCRGACCRSCRWRSQWHGLDFLWAAPPPLLFNRVGQVACVFVGTRRRCRWRWPAVGVVVGAPFELPNMLCCVRHRHCHHGAPVVLHWHCHAYDCWPCQGRRRGCRRGVDVVVLLDFLRLCCWRDRRAAGGVAVCAALGIPWSGSFSRGGNTTPSTNFIFRDIPVNDGA